MKQHLNKIWYKDYLWYFKIFTAGLALGFLIYGFYMDVFVEYWYIKPYPSIGIEDKFYQNHAHFQNFDLLMSFYSVQVNIITIVWLILSIFNHHKENKTWFFGVNVKLAILNWDIIMFIIFWIGIITGFRTNQLNLGDFTTAQKACTTVTHFILPILFFIYVFISFGTTTISLKKEFWIKDLWLSVSYPLFYWIYVLIRAKIWLLDYETLWAFPYPFLDIYNPFIENVSPTGMVFLIGFSFFLIFGGVQLLLTWFNNAMYKVFLKNQNKVLWYEKIIIKIKTKIKKRK
ncbi:hypothetical protein SSYRP_v1c06260 [Spiroplasma syrphidicola EA-1]|uniref:Transmembrane protein n=1 Tax=Spiroplasma syrphidicola EA-1 TaxID=1276229 RepID=R4ULX1_9MOLU|nr:hypothetical protein [Spiroplasma syrphidicola]AGM26216.1 hypothetical protein SSYRP_v1c06260 [Spiroplasma syrphidicola EA-1]